MSDSSLVRSVQNMSPTRRFLTLGGVAAAIVLIWWIASWASAPTYVSLYRDLELNEASAVAENLNKAGISNRLSGGGSEILVPASDVARARVTLAKDGLPGHGRPGLELFDKPSWGMTDFTQRVTYQRALEGELARTIGALRGVERAQVHLVLPTSSPLRRLERPAGASVVLSLKPGVNLAPDAVQGITYIVSNSVEQLSADNVAVMDDAGHVLSVPASDGSGAGMTTRQLDIQRSVERYLSNKVEELLEPAVGMGRVRAQVSAQLSFEQVDRTIESFDPDGQVLQNEQRSETGSTEGNGSQTVVNNEYQNSRKLEKIIGSAGNVTRLTVAVLVDEKAIPAGAGASGPRLDKLESMVWNAIGVDSTRGDRVSIMAVPFEAATPADALPAAAPAKAPADPVQIAERLSRPLIGLVAIVGLLVVAIGALRSSGRAPQPAEPTAAGGRLAEGAEGNGAAIPPGLRQMVDSGEQPETTARVMRAWLAEN